MSTARSTFTAEELIQVIPSYLLKLSKDGFYALDHEFRYVYWSEGMTRITGISADEVIGKVAFEIFPFLREIGQDKVLAAVLEGENLSTHTRPFTVPESGKAGYFEASYYPYRSSTGEVLGILAIVTDVTEQKNVADLQSETETRFRNMADSSPVMLWMSGKDALCTFFNQSWLEFSGKSLDQELGVGWAEGIHPFDFQRCMDTYLACFNERKAFEMEYRLLRSDGQYRWILDRGTPRYSTNQSFEGYIGSCIDITERKMLEDELRKSIHQREEFLSIASHELKTPLTSLGLQIQIFRHVFKNSEDPGKIAEQVAPMIDVADRQLHHMADLIEKLLDISRIEAGNFRMELTEVDINQVVNEIVQRLSEVARQANCDLVVVSQGPLVGLWDRSRLEQVVSNLIVNATKYAAGTPIEVRLKDDGKMAILEIEDHGPGIEKEKFNQVFDKFHRGTSNKNPGGLGLGLFIVKEIVHSHGGKVIVENGKEKGALFRVELPLSPRRA